MCLLIGLFKNHIYIYILSFKPKTFVSPDLSRSFEGIPKIERKIFSVKCRGARDNNRHQPLDLCHIAGFIWSIIFSTCC
uniref:Ovule protein n=1 Tax=Heterorhabditis bacteriophora TaxID=37862 RepID=A0A1I7WB79_HETBA